MQWMESQVDLPPLPARPPLSPAVSPQANFPSLTAHPLSHLPQLESIGDFETLIRSLRNHVQSDPRGTFADPWVKHWCARRFRNLLIREAARDARAVSVATIKAEDGTNIDGRCAEHKVSERFLKGSGPVEWMWAVEEGPAREHEVSDDRLLARREAQRLRDGYPPLPPVVFPDGTELREQNIVAAATTSAHDGQVGPTSSVSVANMKQEAIKAANAATAKARQAAQRQLDVVDVAARKRMGALIGRFKSRSSSGELSLSPSSLSGETITQSFTSTSMNANQDAIQFDEIATSLTAMTGPSSLSRHSRTRADASLPRVTITFCPGLLNGLIPVRAFAPAFSLLSARLSPIPPSILRVDAHPLRSSTQNIPDYVTAFDQGRGLDAEGNPVINPDHAKSKTMCLTYSKGSPDLLEFLCARPDAADRVAALVVWAGAVYGSFAADGAYTMAKKLMPEAAEKALQDELSQNSAVRDSQLSTTPTPPSVNSPTDGLPSSSDSGALGKTLLPLLCPLPLRPLATFPRTDQSRPLAALASVTTAVRGDFMSSPPLRSLLARTTFPIFCVTGSTSKEDVPYFQTRAYKDLLQYGPNNDMQLVTEQSLVAPEASPLTIHLAIVNANHWDMAFEAFPSGMRAGSKCFEHLFPSAAGLAAMVGLVGELGLFTAV
ncbi:hypothetical protein DFS34DRAFT_16342 [Phlyctochytrium arcticum]|nr:hypothetical protein DFS34DRAFT_16342 [Phlyctochytrium arcticum]